MINALSLRVRPPKIRFYILSVSESDVYVSTTHRSLSMAIDKGVHTLYVTDLKYNKVIKVGLPETFLKWWAKHYDDTESEFMGREA